MSLHIECANHRTTHDSEANGSTVAQVGARRYCPIGAGTTTALLVGERYRLLSHLYTLLFNVRRVSPACQGHELRAPPYRRQQLA
jgi:hypothetical protein